ncbi:MAG: hypothetical protein ACREV7_21240 [Steroidobacteraceae bacterium]
MTNEQWYKDDYKVGGIIKHSGITTDKARREKEHQQRWPGGNLEQVGSPTTEQAAREWEKSKQKAITPERK